MSILQGLQVIEVSATGAAAFASKHLADWGAQVFVFEPSGGSPLRDAPPYYEKAGVQKSALWAWLSRGKTSVKVGPDRATTQEAAREACSKADLVLVESEMAVPMLGLKAADVLNAFQTTCVLISPFASDGPYANYQATDLGITALGGWMSVLGNRDREPIRPGGEVLPRITGLFALAAALHGLRYARAGGPPQSVEVSAQAAAASVIIAPWLVKRMLGFEYERRGNPWPMGAMKCADGYVGIPPLTPTHWEMMCQMMGIGDIFQDPQAHDYMWRMAHETELHERVKPWLAERTRNEIFAEAQALRLPAAPFETVADRLVCPQLKARNFWVRAEIDGRGVKVPRVSYSIQRQQPVERAPLKEADGLDLRQSAGQKPVAGASVPQRPLEGIRVLDLTWFWSGPYAMMMLAAFGADVIKIESMQRPDPYRYIWAPLGRDKWWESGPLWVDTNSGKRDITLDLSSPRGKEIFEELASKADIVISNFANRVMPNLGLTAEHLLQLNPQLVVVTMPGYGPGGPWEDYAGYGVAFEQLVCATMTGYADDDPQMMGGFCDPVVGLHVVAAIELALEAREQTGRGVAVEVPQCETLDSIFAPEHIAVQHGAPSPMRSGNKHVWMAPHNVYRVAGNDQWLSIAVSSDPEFSALAGTLGQPQLASDTRFATVTARKRNEAEIDEIMSELLGGTDGAELERKLQAAGVKACRVNKSYLLPEDENLKHIGFFQELTRDLTGAYMQKTFPFRFSTIDTSHRRAAPTMGGHTAEVLTALSGVTEGELERLRDQKITGSAPLPFAE
ncbi:MAG TPA: CoA transferase [Dehalococcoidia bacterium]|nr:CoA transferase [Dehalococcoidia bacterium]